MSTSDRYRQLADDLRIYLKKLEAERGEVKEAVMVGKAYQGLAELQEQVGDIPRIRLEAELTPVLLRAHSNLDRARVLFEEAGAEDRAAEAWELEQKIYRLLNDL
ncbi:MAG: hypothetical protein IH614_18395 [Desulfuromonadales bacterium]|nr:hypothetical protein [Desulfuromonadales bacterium]